MTQNENNNQTLEHEVIAQLEIGRKVNAIKKLRELRGIGLKEAKELVDAYCDKNEITPRQGTVERSGSGMGIMGLIIFAVIAYFMYQNFT
jgi:hypothetical protein